MKPSEQVLSVPSEGSSATSHPLSIDDKNHSFKPQGRRSRPIGVAGTRTIYVDQRALDGVEQAEAETGKQFRAAEENSADIETPYFCISRFKASQTKREP
jgi:hypothetical protein